MSAHSYPITAEHRLIDLIREWTGNSSIGDDCAVLPEQVLVTSDMLVEGTHFLLSLTSVRDLGWKAVAVNLSDIAAMAGRPRYVIVDLSLPPGFAVDQVRQLYQSMVDCARTYRATVVGGDLTGGQALVLALTVIGEAHESGLLRRSGARPGDIVLVCGDFGASAAGLWALRQGLGGHELVKTRHCRPLPRLKEAWLLAERAGGRGALMDASDGLADCLVQLARASGVGMHIDGELIPVAQETRQLAAIAGLDPLDWALYGGEDYELVACLPVDIWERWSADPENPFQAIGAVTAQPTIVVSRPGLRQSEVDLLRGFQHFGNLT